MLLEVGGEDLDDGFVVQLANPRAIVQRLGDYVTRRLVALELDHDQVAAAVDGQQVDAATVIGKHLAADDHPVVGRHRDIAVEDALEPLFQTHGAPVHDCKVAIDTPKTELERHEVTLLRRRARRERPGPR
jgi:hypothetical protein